MRGALAAAWDFVVGDDWRLALTTALAIGVAALLVAIGLNAWWALPVVVAAGLAVAVLRDRLGPA
jgi:hypothetical protein